MYCVWFDPAKSHLAPSIRVKLKAANVHVFCLPTSITHKYQLVDVYIAALLKRCIAKQWALWISLQLKKAYEGGNDNEEVFMQQSGNYMKPSLALCVIWSNKAWEELKGKKQKICKKAKDLHMLGIDTEIIPFMSDYYAGKFKGNQPLENAI